MEAVKKSYAEYSSQVKALKEELAKLTLNIQGLTQANSYKRRPSEEASTKTSEDKKDVPVAVAAEVVSTRKTSEDVPAVPAVPVAKSSEGDSV